MALYKIVLDDDFKEEYSLIAIHCSEEAYKMAYLMNKSLNWQLKRESTDLDCSKDGLKHSFPLFVYEDVQQYMTCHLVANKCKTVVSQDKNTEGLFIGVTSERIVTSNLLPEYKKVDYFLKIFSEFESIPLRKIIAEINEITQVISAYEVASETLKSKNNLIFN
ncbi:IPExxxVDY family protein [Ulvibacter antarcticus]|uniref:IPExxxVDY family protein n=1 Tax=Ulvibacter antarcticus TaxID=442714 RepID=A0A3L9Z3U5_9FLAO|nr:IPExxxVDY family protein [Ulvibacter antarcticus]RMA66099.1 hypothetical protein BXY75_0518 [Ulvibacter antarcticus]